MRGVYRSVARFSNINSARTLVIVQLPAGKEGQVVEAHVTNESNNTSQQLSLQWQKITTLGTPTATTVTPSKMEAGDQAAGFTVKMNVTASEPTYGASDADAQGAMGVPSTYGYHYEPVTPEGRFQLGSAENWGLRLIAPATFPGFDAVIDMMHREIG